MYLISLDIVANLKLFRCSNVIAVRRMPAAI